MNTSHLRRRVGVLLAAVGLVALVMTPSAPARAVAERPVGAASLAQKGCDQWRSAVAGYTKWAKSKSSCSYVGPKSTPAKPAKKGFAWSIPPGSNGRICVQAKGYSWDKKAKKTVAKWYSMGCGTSGSGSVPWTGWLVTYQGKSSYLAGTAMPEVRAKVQPGFLGGAYAWRH